MDIGTQPALQHEDPTDATFTELGAVTRLDDSACPLASVEHTKQSEDEGDDTVENNSASKQQPSGKDHCHQACEWLPSAKREALLHAINAKFQTPLGKSTEDLERCRAFWQHADDLQCRLRFQEIPTRLRPHLHSYTLENYERFLCTWVRGQARTLTEKKMAHVMLDTLNDIISATNGCVGADATRNLGSDHDVTTPQTNKRSHEEMMLGSQRKPRWSSQKAVRPRQGMLGGQRTMTLNFGGGVYDAVRQTSKSLAKWYELLLRRNKGSLVAEVIQVAIACATTLAMVTSEELLHEVQHNSQLLATISFAIHKLVQLGASLVQEDRFVSSVATCIYFVRLSGGAHVRVNQTCYTAILASVNLHRAVWPQGFSNFTKLEDMPTLPPPKLVGHLYDYLSNNAALKNVCVTLQRRLLQRMASQKDVLLCCTSRSMENLLQLFKEKIDVKTGEIRDGVDRRWKQDILGTDLEITNDLTKSSSEEGCLEHALGDCGAIDGVEMVRKHEVEDLELELKSPQVAMVDICKRDEDLAAVSSDDEDELIVSLGARAQNKVA
mmetsp:Transcript_32473/g.51881  ORF Transcript_32473/g.51881 Transcript_32473/m.51881 type:complete len:552 (-) Transcript_32473:68-1723(-)